MNQMVRRYDPLSDDARSGTSTLENTRMRLNLSLHALITFARRLRLLDRILLSVIVPFERYRQVRLSTSSPMN
jgi:hypothetical protein